MGPQEPVESLTEQKEESPLASLSWKLAIGFSLVLSLKMRNWLSLSFLPKSHAGDLNPLTLTLADNMAESGCLVRQQVKLRR